MVDRFHIGKDGRTSYFRRKGKNTHPILVPIFEKILYKPLEKAGRNKFEEQIVKIILAPLKECSDLALLSAYLLKSDGIMNMFAV